VAAGLISVEASRALRIIDFELLLAILEGCDRAAQHVQISELDLKEPELRITLKGRKNRPKKMPPRVIYWFRTDLRLHDSPALKAALDLNAEAFWPIWYV